MVRKIRIMGNMVTNEYYSLSRKRGAGQARSRRMVRNVVRGTSRTSKEEQEEGGEEHGEGDKQGKHGAGEC